ncbi:4'-phosphopantetheinyl transferase family protein [Micromonospora sp. CPCC 206061]|uniref:4'-phosphopantetheinyl transferase family protein n=1 Tax=Micromonospora sp. CPCC 206061 TaxID=3122410 RepID=UPI002FF27D15
MWLIPTDVPPDGVAELAAVLDEQERRRADALAVRQRRMRYIAAHAAARVLIGRYLDARPGSVQFTRGPHGKPEVAGLRVNLSHSGDLAALAVTTRRAVGVDVQRLLPHLDAPRMAARYFPAAEARYVAAADPVARFAELWARKEACVKAAGGRLVPGLAVTVHPGPCVARQDGRSYRWQDLAAPAGFRAAVALEGSEGFSISPRWFKIGSR